MASGSSARRLAPGFRWRWWRAGWLCALLSGLAPLPAAAQWVNYLSPGMQYQTMWQANASFILSQAQQNYTFWLRVPLRGQDRRQPPRAGAPAPARGKAAPPPAAGAGPSASPAAAAGRSAAPAAAAASRSAPPAAAAASPGAAPVARPQPEPAKAGPPAAATAAPDFRLTDFRPVRSVDISEQFARLSDNPKHRPALRTLAREMVTFIETSEDFRRNNLSYALALVVGAALGIESGVELAEQDSQRLLQAAHDFIVETQILERNRPEQVTAFYDNCLVFVGLMVSLDALAREQGDATARAVAREVAGTILRSIGYE